MTIQERRGVGVVIVRSRNLMGVLFCRKKFNILMLGSVLYLNNVTNSNFGVFPGRFDGDCVRGRVENLMIFFCIKKKKKPLQQLAKYLNIKIL